MDDDDGELVRQRDRLDLERAAIDQERAARATRDRGQLIHDPAGDARRKLLGALAGEGELRRRQFEARDVAQRERERHLQRGRRREPGADGDRRRDPSIHPDVRPALLAEHRAQGVDVAVRAGVPVEPVDFDDVVRPRRRVHDALEVDRHRQDKAVVVVGVVADQVDAARRAEATHGRPGRRSEAPSSPRPVERLGRGEDGPDVDGPTVAERRLDGLQHFHEVGRVLAARPVRPVLGDRRRQIAQCTAPVFAAVRLAQGRTVRYSPPRSCSSMGESNSSHAAR